MILCPFILRHLTYVKDFHSLKLYINTKSIDLPPPSPSPLRGRIGVGEEYSLLECEVAL